MPNPPDLTRRPAAEFTPAQLADCLTAGFEDYLIPARFTAEGLERRMRPEHLDPYASSVYLEGDRPAGVILIARRGWTSRVAAMGVAKPFRGRGVGRRMLEEALEEARARGDRRMLLEVFEQNPAAVRLYQAVGFRVTRRLLGYERPAEPGEAAGLVEIDPLDYARVAAREYEPDLPWMLAPETLCGWVAPARAFRLGEAGSAEAAYALVNDTPGQSFLLWGLLVPAPGRRKGWGRRMVRALAALHGGKACRVVQVVPEDLAPQFLARLGFTPLPLNQFEMRHDLGS